jgi:VanZ family protein
MLMAFQIARIARVLFWFSVGVTFIAAVMPRPHPGGMVVSWDRGDHFLSFYVLTVIAGIGFSPRKLIHLAGGLAAFGLSIELIQALPLIHRDSDVWDWIADLVGIAAVVGPILIGRWQIKLGGQGTDSQGATSF